jgi:DNA-directed RNA polymerase subunit RPC12/RpoP
MAQALKKNDMLQGNYALLKENTNWIFGKMIDLNKIEKAGMRAKYYSEAKPAFRGDIELIKSDLEQLKWNKEKLLIDSKVDGLRISCGKDSSDKVFIWVDPEELKKKSPSVIDRLPQIEIELDKVLNKETVLDAELIMMSRDKKEILHRVNANSCLNSKEDPKYWQDHMVIFVFDCLFYNGKDIRELSLEERLEYLHKIHSSDHIWIERVNTNIKEKADSYICNGSDIKKIKTAWNKITEYKTGRPKFMVEGCLIKKLNHKYQVPQNKGWMKIKKFYELDCVVLDKHKVAGSTKTYNYNLGIFISDDYAKKLLKDTKAKKKVTKLDNRHVLYLSKSDNSNIQASKGDCLRIAAEEILSYKTEDGTEYYSFYIGRVMENVYEKKGKSDTLQTMNRLSLLQPKRIPIEELARWKQESVIKSIEEKWQNLSKNEILNFNYIDSEEGEINGKERKTKEKNSEISTARILSLSSEEKGQTEEKVNDIKEKEKEEKEVSYDGNGRKKAHEEKEKEGKKEGKKEKGKEGESTIIVGKETWLHLKCPSCNSNLSFPSIILNKEKNIHCPWCNHNFLIKREDDS